MGLVLLGVASAIEVKEPWWSLRTGLRDLGWRAGLVAFGALFCHLISLSIKALTWAEQLCIAARPFLFRA